jgi:hypothetical protein
MTSRRLHVRPLVRRPRADLCGRPLPQIVRSVKLRLNAPSSLCDEGAGSIPPDSQMSLAAMSFRRAVADAATTESLVAIIASDGVYRYHDVEHASRRVATALLEGEEVTCVKRALPFSCRRASRTWQCGKASGGLAPCRSPSRSRIRRPSSTTSFATPVRPASLASRHRAEFSLRSPRPAARVC